MTVVLQIIVACVVTLSGIFFANRVKNNIH